MTDSPSARRILGDALHAKPQTPDEAYEALLRVMREPVRGTGPQIAQAVFEDGTPVERVRVRHRPLHPYHSGPAIGVPLVIVALIVVAVVRWMGLA